MKISTLFIILILSLQFSCTPKQPVEEEIVEEEYTGGPIVNIDSICQGKKDFKENCFMQEEACYFKISGEGDWTKMNKAIEDTVLSFINSSRLSSKCVTDKGAPEYLGWAHTYYEILESHDGIVSVVLYLTNGFGGGNNWTPAAKVFNIDPVKIELISNEELLSNVDREMLNKAIYKFFNTVYPGEVEKSIGHNFLDEKIDVKRLEYGVRNDSLCLVTSAFPAEHPSYDIHIIPIKLLE